MRETSRTSRI